MVPVLCCGLGGWGLKAPGEDSGADGASSFNVVQLSRRCAALGGCARAYLGQWSCCQALPAGTRIVTTTTEKVSWDPGSLQRECPGQCETSGGGHGWGRAAG